TYEVSLNASNFAGSNTTTVSPMITVGQATPPVITVFNDTLYCSHAASYKWYYNGSLIPGAVDSFYVFSGDGNYSVFIADDLGCTILSGGFLITEREDVSNDAVKIYPTPVRNQF